MRLEPATTAASQSPVRIERHASYIADMDEEQAVRTVTLLRYQKTVRRIPQGDLPRTHKVILIVDAISRHVVAISCQTVGVIVLSIEAVEL